MFSRTIQTRSIITLTERNSPNRKIAFWEITLKSQWLYQNKLPIFSKSIFAALGIMALFIALKRPLSQSQ